MQIYIKKLKLRIFSSGNLPKFVKLSSMTFLWLGKANKFSFLSLCETFAFCLQNKIFIVNILIR